ncbi:MAG: response regulator [Bacteroidota bacterium]
MHKNAHVILADDDPDDTDLYAIILKRLDATLSITVVEDGQELLQQLENTPLPQLVLLDLNMPRIRGRQCIELIRSNRQYNDVPVIVLSTCTQLQVKYDCLDLGANDYYVKPRSLVAIELLLGKVYEEHLAANYKMVSV